MEKEFPKKTNYNKISRNGILENDKFGIIKKFGFMSSFMSTTIQSKNKSFYDDKIFLTTEISNKNAFKNKSFIKRNKSSSKNIILKTKSLKKIKPINKEDFEIKKCQNIFSYAQKVNFTTDKKKNIIDIISKSFMNSYSLKKNQNNNKTNNLSTIKGNNNKTKSRIKNVIFNQSIIKKKKRNESYQKDINKNYKIKYKFLFGKIKYNKNNQKNNFDSKTVSLVSDENNNLSTKREKYSDLCTEENNQHILVNNNKKDNGERENYFDINDNYSSEKLLDKYYGNNYNIIEPCKNFHLLTQSNNDDNLCDLDNDISEKRSNDNNIDKSSSLANNINDNNNLPLFKEKYLFEKNYFNKNYLISLLKNNDSCDISPRNDLNVYSKINNYEQLSSKKFKFISDIQIDTEKFPVLNINNFLNLKDYEIFRLLSFMYDYSSNLLKTNSLIKSKIINSLNNIFSETINGFSYVYSSFLKVINYYYQNRKIIINKKPSYTFNLVVICKVITKEINKSYELSYNYISNNKEYDNLWKIDIKKKNNIKLWLHTELFKLNNCYNPFTYSSQISSFSYGDEIKFEINIFNQNCQLNPKSIEWFPPVVTNIDDDFFETNKFISNKQFDPLRCNEIEIQTLIWEELSLNDNNALIKEYKNIFEKNFEIKSIYSYSSKHTFYKFKIIANKKGIFHKNKYLFFDLNIIDYEEELKNEVQSIYLMNSNYYTKKMDIRLGTIVIFYITDYKG